MQPRTALVALAFAVAAAPGAARAQAERDVGLLVRMRGDVQRVSRDLRVTMRAGMQLVENDVVRTGVRSSASIRLADGTLLVLGERTELALTRAVVGDRTVEVNLLLRVGRVFATVAGWSGFERAFSILTPAARIHARGTELEVVVGEDGPITAVTVFEGRVSIDGSAGMHEVGAGETWDSASRAVRPAPSDARPPSGELGALGTDEAGLLVDRVLGDAAASALGGGGGVYDRVGGAAASPTGATLGSPAIYDPAAGGGPGDGGGPGTDPGFRGTIDFQDRRR